MALTVMAKKRFSYACYQDEHGALILSVLCGSIGMYELNIPLSAEDAQKALTDTAFLDGLAETIRSFPQDYLARSVVLAR